tara:strand:- start:2682 stop:2960 length:279 start_codon:yes stop_codon:yes gene_type:complete
MSISKKDLSNSLKKETDLSMRDASIFVDNFFKILSKSFQKNEEVKISGFGSFKKFSTKARMGRNPKTMQPFPIPPKLKIKFLASNKVKKMLN